MNLVKLTFLAKSEDPSPSNIFKREVDAEEGETLLEAALRNEVPIQHACGGYCACTTCHVKVSPESEGSFSAMESDEEDRLEKNGLLEKGSRLACQTKIVKAGCVEIQNIEP